MAKDLPKKLLDLLSGLEPKMRQEFLSIISRLKDNVKLVELIKLIEAGNIDGAVKLIGADPSDFSSLARSVSDSYWAGGGSSLTGLPRAPLGLPGTGKATLGFNGQAPLAESWIKTSSSELIQGISDDQKGLIQDTLISGVQKGKGSRAVALDLVGKINPSTGVREGGVLGLTRQQGEWVRSVEEILSDPSRIREYFIKDQSTGKWKPRYKLTSRVHDKAVLKALQSGKPLDADRIAKIKKQYEAALLKDRARTISRTETLNGMRAGRHQGYQQLIDEGRLKASAIEVRWQSTPDLRTRHTHRVLDGNIVGFGELFVSPSGALMAHPGDTTNGAPAEEIINCRCWFE